LKIGYLSNFKFSKFLYFKTFKRSKKKRVSNAKKELEVRVFELNYNRTIAWSL